MCTFVFTSSNATPNMHLVGGQYISTSYLLFDQGGFKVGFQARPDFLVGQARSRKTAYDRP
ncbi:hypothetical protein MTR_8g094605 [Medicago truncatula]|uniref:Peptidase A1 domain-containing protein n=1 Tax=Medicago truncatula TaxID=3880 RepID=A0A072U523_MEDTR|nr:hypothetical protein MTR_8g094605 [Medicago truncatula]